MKEEDQHGIIKAQWMTIFEKLEDLAQRKLVSWNLLISLATWINELDFHLAACFAVTFQIVRFIPSLTGRGGMTMHQLQSVSGLKLRTPSSMMNLLLMPNMVWC
jgi:hypothetical protein